MNNLKLIVPENFKEFGKDVNKYINKIRNTNENYIIDMDLVRFNNGEGKCVLNESIDDMDIYILLDVFNYEISYEYRNGIHYMMPDEHYVDLKRIISAIDDRAASITVIMPFLYQSRQDKKYLNVSFDCGMFLKELEYYGVDRLITFDVHNPSVASVLSNKMNFNNNSCIENIIVNILEKENIDKNKLFIVSPDEGAIPRAKTLSNMLGVEYGYFVKRRDYNKIEGGKNPILFQEFIGPNDLAGLDIVIVDDMIATGTSLINAASKLKDLGASNIYLMATFSLFTNGVEFFNEANNKGIFTKLYSTNLTYIPKEYKLLPWYESVDCSYKVAKIINELDNKQI